MSAHAIDDIVTSCAMTRSLRNVLDIEFREWRILSYVASKIDAGDAVRLDAQALHGERERRRLFNPERETT